MWHAEKMLGFIFIIIIIYLFPFAAMVTFSVHWNINIRHQDEKLVGEIGERGTSYVFTAWHSERSLKLLKSWFYSWISRLFPINSEMRLRAFIYLSWIEDCSFIRCLGIQCSFFFCCVHFFPRGSPVPCCLQSTLLRLLLLLWTCKHFLHRI